MAFLPCNSLYFIVFILCASQFLHESWGKKTEGSVDDIIIEFINASYINEDTFDLSVNYKEDGNTININVDVISELPTHIFLKLKVLARALGQYKVPTGISMDDDICDGKLKKFLLEGLLSSLGVDIQDCPPKPGNYEIQDFMGEIKALPLYALPGLDLLVDVELYSPPNISIMKVKGYGHVN